MILRRTRRAFPGKKRVKPEPGKYAPVTKYATAEFSLVLPFFTNLGQEGLNRLGQAGAGITSDKPFLRAAVSPPLSPR